jgi:hypothetical protein
MATRRSVFAPVTALAFSADQLADLKSFLTRRSDQTEVVPISDADQLLMAADGRLVESGYRFNYIGFMQLTNAMVTGLGSVFKELSGEVARRQRDNPTPDLAAAVSIYNTVVRAQIDRLRERSLLVDHRERVIDGFLGLDYRLLDNSAFLDLVIHEVAVCQPRAQYYRAELIGRELMLYFLDHGSRRNDIIENSAHVFTRGWQFVNGEGTNRAVNGTSCVFTKFGLGVEPKASKRGFLQHSGADLAGRAAALVSRAAASEIDMDLLAQGVRKLVAVNLGFTENGFTEHVARVAESLLRFKIPGEDAKLIAKNAAMVGSDLKPRDSVDVFTDKVLKTRTGYDLVCALLRHSRAVGHLDAVRYQQAAMRSMYPAARRTRKS